MKDIRYSPLCKDLKDALYFPYETQPELLFKITKNYEPTRIFDVPNDSRIKRQDRELISDTGGEFMEDTGGEDVGGSMD